MNKQEIQEYLLHDEDFLEFINPQGELVTIKTFFKDGERKYQIEKDDNVLPHASGDVIIQILLLYIENEDYEPLLKGEIDEDQEYERCREDEY